MITQNIRRVLDRLRKHKGEFELDGHGHIGHKTLRSITGSPSCPLAVDCGASENGDLELLFERTGLGQDEGSEFVLAADNSHVAIPELRQAILDACLA